jgi:hypothetical protein
VAVTLVHVSMAVLCLGRGWDSHEEVSSSDVLSLFLSLYWEAVGFFVLEAFVWLDLVYMIGYWQGEM